MARSSWRGLRLVVSMAIAAGALTALPATPVAAVGNCSVKVTTALADGSTKSLTLTSLATALLLASDGDTLVMQGLCKGPVAISDDVTIVGRALPGTPAEISGDHIGTTVYIEPSASVAISSLRITSGTGTPNIPSAGGNAGGGIFVRGELTLTDVVVRGNTAGRGGGIFVAGGVLQTLGKTRVYNNKATGDPAASGGGISVRNGSLELGGSTVINANQADGSGGGIEARHAEILMTGSAQVRGNTAGADGADADGGGIHLTDGSDLAMTSTSAVVGNLATRSGGGIATDSTTVRVTMSDRTSIRGNSVSYDNGNGGGAAIAFHASMELDGYASIRGNGGAYGGGVWLDGDLTLRGHAALRGNVVNRKGGGAYVLGDGMLTMEGRSIISANYAPAVGDGGGYYASGIVIGDVCGVNVWDNTEDDCVRPIG